ncbi:hypothetical protein BC828DRAFT_382962 [Blastocladiella britannica]|nr:hypothetical protein BC828DRAFT_382962 [Blastocladiella britannica]
MKLLIGLACLARLATAVFQDQAGVFDWHLPLLGTPRSVLPIGADRAILASDRAFGALNLTSSDGKLVWRHVLPPSEHVIATALCQQQIVTVVAGAGDARVQYWDVSSGSLTGQVAIGRSPATTTTAPTGSVSCGSDNHAIVRVGENAYIVGFDNVRRNFLASSPWLSSMPIVNVAAHGADLTALVRDPASGALQLAAGPMDQSPTISEPLKGTSSATAGHLFSCGSSWSLVVAQSRSSSPAIAAWTRAASSGTLSAITLDAAVADLLKGALTFVGTSNNVCRIQATAKDGIYVIAFSARGTPTVEAYQTKALAATQSATGELVIAAASPGQLVIAGRAASDHAEWIDRIQPSRLWALSADAFLAVGTDGNVHYIRDARIQWTRHESLSTAVQSFVLDYPEPHSWEEEEAPSTGLLERAVDRWRSHGAALVRAATNLFQDSEANRTLSAAALAHDSFKAQKLLVFRTAGGNIYALDSAHGDVVWHQFYPSASKLVLKRATVGSEPALLELTTATHRHVIAPFTGELTTQVSIESTSADDAQRNPLLSFTLLDMTLTVWQRLSFDTKEKVALHQVTIPGTHIIATARADEDSRIASLGRVMPDRSVRFKYINDNVLGVVSKTGPNAIHLELLDVETGRAVASFSQSDVDLAVPIHLLRFDHMAVLLYWNQGSSGPVGWTVTVMEMFTMDHQESSADDVQHARFDLPTISVSSYALPIRDTVTAIDVTKTRNGVTVRDLVYATSRSVGTIPRRVLDALRSEFGAKDAAAEAGIMPYNHVLPAGLDDRNLITYNLEVITNRITTAATALESTSVICAYGFDVFWTRVSPSGAFDQLADSFAKGTLLSICLGLFGAVFLGQELVRRKNLKAAWA